jgi:phosphoadenosine phosphosulfate reductase
MSCLWSPPAPVALSPAALAALRNSLAAVANAQRRPVLTSSLQAEDQVLSAVIAQNALPIDIVVIDTGRLHEETSALVDATAAALKLPITVVRPDDGAVADLEVRDGRHGFYESLAARQACCGVRKVAPLERILAGRDAWITGQRRDQNPSRTALPLDSWDAHYRLRKLNPLAEWSFAQVWSAARSFGVPLHPLYARGYASIGCEPCTRAVRADEEPRAGRWWWEQAATKECGLHVKQEATA